MPKFGHQMSLRFVSKIVLQEALMKLNISNVVDHFLYFGLKERSQENLFNLANENSIIFDVGANIGSTVLQFAQKSKNGFVYGFEPDKLNYQRAMENISLNSFPNIKVYNFGIGDQDYKLKLYQVNELNPGMNRILTTTDNEFPYSEIEIKILDTIVSNLLISQIDIIKIDVEGYEYHVLKGAQNTIRTYMPYLFIELDDNNLKEQESSATELIELLKSYGYYTILKAVTLQTINEVDLRNCHFDIICKKTN